MWSHTDTGTVAVILPFTVLQAGTQLGWGCILPCNVTSSRYEQAWTAEVCQSPEGSAKQEIGGNWL